MVLYKGVLFSYCKFYKFRMQIHFTKLTPRHQYHRHQYIWLLKHGTSPVQVVNRNRSNRKYTTKLRARNYWSAIHMIVISYVKIQRTSACNVAFLRCVVFLRFFVDLKIALVYFCRFFLLNYSYRMFLNALNFIFFFKVATS